MRLSRDKARRLSGLVWRDRARRFLPIILAVLAMSGVFAFMLSKQMARVDGTVEVHERTGEITGLKSGSNARGAAILHVHLDDGRDVEAFSGFRVVPPKGTHVVLSEARHASGKLTYDLVRLIDN